MFRINRKAIALFVAGCLLLAATSGFTHDFALRLLQPISGGMPAATVPCHDAGAMQTITHKHDSGKGNHALCAYGSAVCCAGFTAVLPARFVPLTVAEASSWRLPNSFLRLSARAVEIFKPPRLSS
jgi:hypothetical protein